MNIMMNLSTVSSVLDLTVSHIFVTPAGAVQKILHELVAVTQRTNPCKDISLRLSCLFEPYLKYSLEPFFLQYI